jgi:hypothetical protein
MRWVHYILLVLCAGCTSPEDSLHKAASLEQQATAKTYIARLRSGDFDAIEKAIDPNIKTPTLRATLERMAQSVPAGEPSSVKLVGVQKLATSAGTTLNTTFEYGFGEKWFLINVVIKDSKSEKTLVGLNVVPQLESLEAQNKFTFSGKSWLQYAVLIGGVLAIVLTLYALVACVRTKLLRRKWLWILFILVGFGKFTINWVTGQWMFTPLAVQVLSVSTFAEFYGPWTISISAPVGAVAFLIFLRKKLAEVTDVNGV